MSKNGRANAASPPAKRLFDQYYLAILTLWLVHAVGHRLPAHPLQSIPKTDYKPTPMTSIIAQLESHFREAIHSAWGVDADPLIAISGNDKFGDYQSNAAMGLAKILAEKTGQKSNPRAIAEKIKASLNLAEIATETSIAGP